MPGCERPHNALGLCRRHYSRKQKRGHVTLPISGLELPCTVEDCDRNQRSRGLCDRHYRRLRANGDPTVSRRRRWTAEEDRALLELPRHARSGETVHGYLQSAAEHMDRTYEACGVRLGTLRQRAAVKLREKALVSRETGGTR